MGHTLEVSSIDADMNVVPPGGEKEADEMIFVPTVTAYVPFDVTHVICQGADVAASTPRPAKRTLTAFTPTIANWVDQGSSDSDHLVEIPLTSTPAKTGRASTAKRQGRDA